jgi:enoyl-CoA hydratase/carnithine racemase
MSELILSEQDGDVATITINRADDGNRINDSMANGHAGRE